MLNLFNVYKFYFLAAILAIFVSLILWKQYQVNSLRAKLAESTAQVTILSASIETQNNAVAQLKIDNDKRTQLSQDALNKAKAISVSKQSKIIALNAQLGKVQDCNAAVKIARDTL